MEKAMAPHTNTLAWKIPWTEEPGRYRPWGHTELDTTERLSRQTQHTCSLSVLTLTLNSTCYCLVAPSCPTLCNTTDAAALQAPLSIGFSRQEYWSWLPFSPPGDLAGQGLEPEFPAWQVDSLPLSQWGSL